MTSQGHPRSTFRRALERGNLLVAEATLGEIGRPTLEELLQLTALICSKQPERGRRAAARFLELYLAATGCPIDEATLVASLLTTLGGRHHHQALTSLLDMLETASSATSMRDVASS